MCALTPFGQTGPWRDYMTSDLLHMAAGGQMASCDEVDALAPPPIAPGGGNAWHMGCHYAYIAIMAALVYRTAMGRGQCIYRCLDPRGLRLTTEAAIPNYIYRKEVVRRQTGRHHAPGPTPRTQFRKDGKYVTALVAGRLNPRYVKELAELLDSYGMAGDLKDAKYQDPKVIEANRDHIIEELVGNFIANPSAEEVHHAAPGARVYLGPCGPGGALG